MRRSLAPFVVFAALSVAACSASDATPATVPPTITPAPAPDAPTTTTDVTTAATAPITEPPATTATTTSIAPTTTIDPITEIEAAVKQARLDGEAAINAAGLHPEDGSLRAIVARYNTGERLDRTLAFLDELASRGEAFRQRPENPSRIEFRGSIELPDGPSSTEAFLQECRVDTDVIFVVQADSAAAEIVVDDEVVTVVGTVRYVLTEGQWKNESGTTTQRLIGSDRCPA